MSLPIDLTNPPERYWHCVVTLTGKKDHSIVNDLSFADLQRTIVVPWTTGKTFAVSGTGVRSSAGVSDIKITHTPSPQNVYAERHNARMRAHNIADIATDRRMLPLKHGTDVTHELLFAGTVNEPQAPDVQWWSKSADGSLRRHEYWLFARARAKRRSRLRTNTTFRIYFMPLFAPTSRILSKRTHSRK
jgi:hypothetical protein